MRHNLRVSPAPPRPRQGRRASRCFGLLTAFLALASLIGVMAPAAQAALPTLSNPGSQESVAGQSITPLKIAGTEIESVTEAGLPEGLTAKVASPSEVEITGTPLKPEASKLVVLHAKNAEGESAAVEFKWTVREPPPSLTTPGPQSSVAGAPIATLKISGERIHELKVEDLPKGLTFARISETEATISGTPERAEEQIVQLTAVDSEKAEVSTTFKWTVTAETAPSIVQPLEQSSSAGVAIVPLAIGGERIAKVSAEGLPKGLHLELRSETEVLVSGIPTHAETTTVTLHAKNKEGPGEATTSFKWTVAPEGAASVTKPADQTSVEGTAIAPLHVTGANMAELAAEGLPAGLSVELRSASEAVIFGTPTRAETATVSLNAKNPEGASFEARFEWRVTPHGPTAPGPPTVSPGVLFSAARATCNSAGWSGGAVVTQWLLDGAPIAGAGAGTFVPPRSDDGHSLSCRQIATANGVSSTLTSATRTIHEQPPQPTWPISAASLHCSSAVCMQQGAAPGAVGQAYQQEGSWWGSQQVRCVSAPWTSSVGSSATAAVRALAEAHAVRISLQRVSAAGVVTVASAETGELAAARDLLDGSPSPFGGAIVVPFGTQPFAAGELWTTLYPGAAGHPNWFVPGGGILTYGVAGAAGAARSFQLTYTLTSADLGAHLRCVAGADDGPAASPTTATSASPEYAVASTAVCGPRRLGGGSLPEPAIVIAGEPRCVPAPSSLSALGSASRQVAVRGSEAAIALVCGLHGGCRGNLALTAVVGGRRTTIAHAPAHVANGAQKVLTLKLSSRAVRAVRAAGSGGLAASVQLESKRIPQRVASALLVASG
jgi:hypothetical protein